MARYSQARAWVAAHIEQESREGSNSELALELDPSTGHTPTVGILSALDAALSTVRNMHPDVPTAIALVISTGMGKKHGSFSPASWADTQGSHAGSGRHEILLASESLARGGKDTLVTLIHEAAHASAHAQGIKDTSRQGRFHNKAFQKMASSMGLIVESHEKIGHITTGLQSWAEEQYAPIIAQLDTALVTHRKPVEGKTKAPKTTIRVQCSCEQPVTVPIKWWDEFGADNLICNLCLDAGDTPNFREV